MVRWDQLVGLSVASLLIHPHLQLRREESEWWGRLASGNTLFPGAGISEAGESLGRRSFNEVPKAPVFDGTEVSYPSWSQNFLLSAKHNNLYEAFVSEAEIPIADIKSNLMSVWVSWPGGGWYCCIQY